MRISKKTQPAGSHYSRQDAERIATELVQLQLDREKLTAERDAARLAAEQPFAPQLDALSGQIKLKLAILEAWADANVAEFGKAESILLAGHRVGWRLGNWTAKTVRGFTWEKVKDALQEAPRKLRDRWLRTKVEPNKQAMIADREELAADLKSIGVTMVQERAFYLEPNREGQESATLVAK